MPIASIKYGPSCQGLLKVSSSLVPRSLPNSGVHASCRNSPLKIRPNVQ